MKIRLQLIYSIKSAIWMCLCFGLLFFSVQFGLAGTMEEALEALESKDFSAAEKLLLQASEEGNAEAQYRLGLLLASGSSDTWNAGSISWLEKSANGGQIEAQKYLAELYMSDSTGNPESPQNAFYWYLQAAKLNDPLAQQRVASFFEQGVGVAKNMEQAIYWYGRAAENEMPWSQFYLARMLLEKNTKEHDVPRALLLLARASKNGFIDADLLLGQLYSEGKLVGVNKVEAAQWYSRASQTGHPLARLQLAELLLNGDGIAQDCEEGLRLLKMSAESGFAEAQFLLGTLYAEGPCLEQDLVQAYAWWFLANKGDQQGAKERIQGLKAKLPEVEFADIRKKAQKILTNYGITPTEKSP